MKNKGKAPESSKNPLKARGLRVEVPEGEVPLLQNKPPKDPLRKTQSSAAEGSSRGKQHMLSPKSPRSAHPLYRTQSEPNPHGYTSLNSPGSPLNKSPLKRRSSQSSTRIGYLTTACGNCIDDVVNCFETCRGIGTPEGYETDDPEVVDARLREIKEEENAQILF
uniref:Uncharacterized protein n=2 Tax=Meloidogyne TaxID=189290 RepID=A0A6V7TIN0_MELEN|nr:unnamed protein product [Meloidogyne enterolobii]